MYNNRTQTQCHPVALTFSLSAGGGGGGRGGLGMTLVSTPQNMEGIKKTRILILIFYTKSTKHGCIHVHKYIHHL